MSAETYRPQILSILEQYETTDRELKQLCRESGVTEYKYRTFISLDLELSGRHVIASDRRRANNWKKQKSYFGTGYSK